MKQSYTMARRLFERAVQQGDMDAMYELGVMYDDGLGVELSHERAFEYYKQAAHLGHQRSEFNVGLMYKSGQGVRQSYEMAKRFYTLAIKHGSTDAMINLGCLYANGDLGDKRDQINMIKARDLLTKAVALGDNRAIEFLENLNDDERETAALDPNAILCSFCGLPETETRNFSKTKCPCKSTWYCNTTCQKKHWKEHRTECKRLIAKFKRKKKRRRRRTKKQRKETNVVSVWRSCRSLAICSHASHVVATGCTTIAQQI